MDRAEGHARTPSRVLKTGSCSLIALAAGFERKVEHVEQRKTSVQKDRGFGHAAGQAVGRTHLEGPAHVAEGVAVNGEALAGGLVLPRPRLRRCISASGHRATISRRSLDGGVARLSGLWHVQLHTALTVCTL